MEHKLTPKQAAALIEKFEQYSHKEFDPLWNGYRTNSSFMYKEQIIALLRECTMNDETTIVDFIKTMQDHSMTFDEMYKQEKEKNLRGFTPECEFEKIFEQTLGERIRSDDKFAKYAYASLCNNVWVNKEKDDRYFCSFRSNGGLIASVRQKGEGYLTWYCSNYGEGIQDGEVHDDIKDALLKHGWTYREPNDED